MNSSELNMSNGFKNYWVNVDNLKLNEYIMNSRERVICAVNFESADRIPIDCGACRASGIHAAVYNTRKRRMGIVSPTKVHDVMQLLAEVEWEALDRLHADIVPLESLTAEWVHQNAADGVKKELFCGDTVYFPPGTSIKADRDGSWLLCNADGDAFGIMPKDGSFFDFIRPTMAGGKIDPDLFRPKRTVCDEELTILAGHAEFLYENTDKAILGKGAGISLLGLSAMNTTNLTQGSLDEWLSMLILEKETATEMMGHAVDAAIDCLKLYYEATGDLCFAWIVGSDDAGTQRSGLISPDLYREMIMPHYRRLCDWVHTNTHWKTFLHSCGSVYHYIPAWIEAGIDIINPVQISAANMEPKRLMAEFSGKIVFWGGWLRHTENSSPRKTGRCVQPCRPQHRNILLRNRRVCFHPGTQYPAECACGKCGDHVSNRI
ncbi:hypothetical protein ES708_20578 [subsurface metagenome]